MPAWGRPGLNSQPPLSLQPWQARLFFKTTFAMTSMTFLNRFDNSGWMGLPRPALAAALAMGLALAMGAFFAAMHVLALQFSGIELRSWQLGCVAVFVVGWVFQFVGHAWEGRKPAFFDDLRGLLVGPLFVLAEALCERCLVMGHGQVVFEGSPTALKANAEVRKEWLEV